MSAKILTPDQERYFKTALATSNIAILDKFGRADYLTDATGAGTQQITTTTHPAGSITRITGTGAHVYNIDYANDSYNVGDEITFVQIHSAATVNATGTDAGGTGEAPTVNTEGASAHVIGTQRTLRKVRDYVSVTSGLETTADQLLTSITVDVTGGSAATYTTVPLTGGSGTGAQVTCVLSGATAIDSITVTTAGSGYTAGDTLYIAAALLGGSSTQVTIVLKADDLAGTVEAEWDLLVG